MKSKKSINELLKNINKQYGKNTIVSAREEEHLEIESISTNSFLLDWVFGCGGIPRGRIIEIFGEESSGKSTMAAFLVAQVQKMGGCAMWVDAEYSFSKDYYKDIGVKFDETLLITQPNCGEEALDVVTQTVKTGDVDIIVVDSVSSLVPREELEGGIDKANIALQARMMSKALRMLTSSIANTKTIVIFINQTRDKMGVYFGNKTTTSGGKALNFYSSIRLEVKKGKKITGKKEEVIGNEMYLSAVKNKVAPPFRKTRVELLYSYGIDLSDDLIEKGIKDNIIKVVGNTYEFDGEKIGVGREKTKNNISKNEELFNKIKQKIYDNQ